jgi:hypothetical protein
VIKARCNYGFKVLDSILPKTGGLIPGNARTCAKSRVSGRSQTAVTNVLDSSGFLGDSRGHSRPFNTIPFAIKSLMKRDSPAFHIMDDGAGQ